MAGEDLLEHLIVPQPPATSSVDSPSPDPESNKKRRIESNSVSGDDDSKYWRHRSQNQTDGSKMEIDTITATPVPPVLDDAMTTTAPSGTADRVLSLSDYLATHQPAPPKSATSPPVPRAVGARSSKYTILLHEKYQALGIPKPDFLFPGGSEQGWSCKVVFVGLLEDGQEDLALEEEGSFRSKQEAKEKLSEKAFAVLEGLEKEGKISKRAKEKKSKENTTEVKPGEKKEKEPVINYVGQLLEFQRSINSPQPTYLDYQLGNSFSCELTIDNHPTPFGSKTTYFTSKKAARQDAARCAVEHFKAAGLWPESSTDVGGIRKKKKTVHSPPPSNPNPNPRSPPLASSVNADGPGGTANSSPSYAQQVAQLATQLSLPTPFWSFSAESSAAPGFHTVSCYFKNSGAHEGPHGEVRHVYGKKKAKEECARLTLEYLLGVKEKRMSYGKRMVEGLVGGGDVAGVAVGKVTGDDGEVEREVLAKEKRVGSEMGEEREESDGEGFEDAMEHHV